MTIDDLIMKARALATEKAIDTIDADFRNMAAAAPDRSGCLWFCGMTDTAIMFDDRSVGYRAPLGRVFSRYDICKHYCTEACWRDEVGPLPPKPYGHTKLAEGGPSAVATAPAREPWVPSVSELDLLPDAGR